ncbi:MAG: starch-binding protein [Prevotella sp.]|nr:starch-binding protein [Prevotella sp.]
MKRIFTKVMMLALMLVSGVASVSALETYDFQELCMKLGKGGPWAVNDGGDAGFTVNDKAMNYLGDYTEQGFEWNKRFAFEYVEADTPNNKMCVRNKSNKKDANCGLFSWDATHYFSVLDLKAGDKVTITCLAGTTTLVSDNVEGIDAGTEFGKVATTYTIASGDRLDIQFAKATLVSKIEIEPYGVETVPVITVTPQTLKLIPGATAKLTANVSPAAETTWTSSDEAVATVAADGTVTALAAGEATITNKWASTVSDATAEASCVITVAAVDLSAYTVVKAYDFTTMGDVTLELQSEAAGAIWNDANAKNNNVFFCTNEGLEQIAVQAAVASNKGWSIVDGQGLFLAAGAGRCAAVGGIKAGQIVEFIYTGNGFYTRSDDDGIEKEALNEGVGRAIYLAQEDGMIGFELIKGNAVQQINVYELPAVETKTVTFINDANWEKVYVWAWNETENFTGGSWPGVEITPVDGVYTWSTTGNPTQIIFSNNGNPQTADLDFEDGATYNSQGKVEVEPEPVTTWTIAGTEALMGSAWDTTDEANDMVSEDNVTFTLVKENVALYKGEYEYKVAKNHGWEVNYPEDVNGQNTNAILTIEKDGYYTVTFTFVNDETHALSAVAEKTGDIPSAEPVYYLVGNMNNWTQSADYVLTLNEAAEGVEYMITLDLEADAAFKVNRTLGNETIWYPGDGAANCTVNTAGQYTVYFRPNADGGEDWYYNVLNPVRIGESTGINAIQAEKLNGVVVYNLNGQRVLNAQKGLYIVNGRMVVVK